MKPTYVFFITLLFSVLMLHTTVNAQKTKETRTVKLETSAYTEMCKEKIEKTLAYERGVINSSLDIQTHILTVTYNPKKTNVKKIIKAITGLGHDAKEITEDENNKK